MSLIDINALHDKANEIKQRKLKIYDEVLQKCHHRIKLVSKMTPLSQFCFYIIPKVLFGIPLYNLEECVKYLIEMLTKNGFQISYTHPNLLYISWKQPNKPITQQSSTRYISTNTSNNNFKNIEDYKPKGNLIYNQSNFNLLEQKKKNLFS